MADTQEKVDLSIYNLMPSVMFVDHYAFPGSVAALASHHPFDSNVQKQFANLMDARAVVASGCNSFCQSAENGNGVVIGTAPFCGGDCSADCHSSHCMTWPANCWTGHKICCCSSK